MGTASGGSAIPPHIPASVLHQPPTDSPQDWLRTNRPEVYENTTYTCVEISTRLAAQQYESVVTKVRREPPTWKACEVRTGRTKSTIHAILLSGRSYQPVQDASWQRLGPQVWRPPREVWNHSGVQAAVKTAFGGNPCHWGQFLSLGVIPVIGDNPCHWG